MSVKWNARHDTTHTQSTEMRCKRMLGTHASVSGFRAPRANSVVYEKGTVKDAYDVDFKFLIHAALDDGNLLLAGSYDISTA